MNIKGTTAKRFIQIKNIEGLSKSKAANNLQFTVHCKDGEHDIRFEAKSAKLRDDLFSVI